MVKMIVIWALKLVDISLSLIDGILSINVKLGEVTLIDKEIKLSSTKMIQSVVVSRKGEL